MFLEQDDLAVAYPDNRDVAVFLNGRVVPDGQLAVELDDAGIRVRERRDDAIRIGNRRHDLQSVAKVRLNSRLALHTFRKSLGGEREFETGVVGPQCRDGIGVGNREGVQKRRRHEGGLVLGRRADHLPLLADVLWRFGQKTSRLFEKGREFRRAMRPMILLETVLGGPDLIEQKLRWFGRVPVQVEACQTEARPDPALPLSDGEQLPTNLLLSARQSFEKVCDDQLRTRHDSILLN